MSKKMKNEKKHLFKINKHEEIDDRRRSIDRAKLIEQRPKLISIPEERKPLFERLGKWGQWEREAEASPTDARAGEPKSLPLEGLFKEGGKALLGGVESGLDEAVEDLAIRAHVVEGGDALGVKQGVEPVGVIRAAPLLALAAIQLEQRGVLLGLLGDGGKRRKHSRRASHTIRTPIRRQQQEHQPWALLLMLLDQCIEILGLLDQFRSHIALAELFRFTLFGNRVSHLLASFLGVFSFVFLNWVLRQFDHAR